MLGLLQILVYKSTNGYVTNCGCPRTEDEVEGSQHWPEDRG